MKYELYHAGKIFRIENPNSHMAKSYALGHPYEWPFLYRLEKNRIGGEFVDVGAHIGNHTCWMGLYGNFKKIYAIEAHRPHYDILCKNIKLNNLTNVRAIHGAASDGIYDYEVITDGPNDGSFHIKEVHDLDLEKTKDIVIGFRLDRILRNAKNITVMKFDIEGHEFRALRGSAGLIKKFKPIIYTEQNTEQYKKQTKEINGYMHAIGYRPNAVIKTGTPLVEWLFK